MAAISAFCTGMSVTHESRISPKKYRTARQAVIDSDQGQFLKGTNNHTGETGAAEMGAQMIAGDTDVLIVVDVQNDFCPGGRLPQSFFSSPCSGATLTERPAQSRFQLQPSAQSSMAR